jgi:hypothetical protein
MDEQAQSVVHKSLGRCTTGACGRTAVWQVVVGWTRLQRDGVGSGAACHKLVHDSQGLQLQRGRPEYALH